jgi:hypothetical protein
MTIVSTLADGRTFILRHDDIHGLCLEIDSVNLGCDDVGPVLSADADPTTARIAIDPAPPYGEVLAYGYLPESAVDVVADLDGKRLTGATLNGALPIWALQLNTGTGTDGPSNLRVIYLLDDGTELPAPTPR